MRPKLILCEVAGLAMLAVFLTACPQVKPNPNDSTPPKVEIQVKINNQFQPKTTFDSHASDEPLNVRCIVTDPEGVRSIELHFTGSTSDHCTVGSSVFSGNFSVPVPAPLQQTLQGNSSGEVLTKLPLFVDVGPFTCKPFGQGQGRPLGHVVKAVCTGTNWSQAAQNATATSELAIKIK